MLGKKRGITIPDDNSLNYDKLSTEEQMLTELRMIREQLVPKVEEPEEELIEGKPKKLKVVRSFYDDFVEFLKKYKVFGLAVAFIMAMYVGDLVQALVADIILPILLYIPGLNQLDKIVDWTVGNFLIGHFLVATITFLIVALVIYLMVKISKKIGLED